MAYDAFGNFTGGQRDPYEEERIRQEEEERKRSHIWQTRESDKRLGNVC